MNYSEFIQSKSRNLVASGIDVSASSLHPSLKDFQRFSVNIALQKGRFGLFEDCGLGKTFQQLEWSRQVNAHTAKPVLILAPLAVTGQTIQEGAKFGIEVNEYGSGKIQITNYEQLANVDTGLFSGIVLDESSILKNHEGAYRNMIMSQFRDTPFKLPCSATPSPNDPMELGNHAEFLGVMSRNEMLATFFVHDGGETAKWRLKKHAQDAFYEWCASWGLMFSRPSDIGFDDEGYVLPELNFIERQITTPVREGKLINDVAVSATNFHKEVRLTKAQRLSEVIDIVNSSNENFIVWVEQNPEGDYLEKSIKDAVQVTGSDTDEFKKSRLLGFSNNEFRVLVTKPKIAAFGMNYQNCHNQVFASPDHSYEKIYQAIRRSLRFGQQHDVNAWLITTDTMESVIASFKRKQQLHHAQQTNMNYHTKKLYNEQYRKVA